MTAMTDSYRIIRKYKEAHALTFSASIILGESFINELLESIRRKFIFETQTLLRIVSYSLYLKYLKFIYADDSEASDETLALQAELEVTIRDNYRIWIDSIVDLTLRNFIVKEATPILVSFAFDAYMMYVKEQHYRTNADKGNGGSVVDHGAEPSFASLLDEFIKSSMSKPIPTNVQVQRWVVNRNVRRNANEHVLSHAVASAIMTIFSKIRQPCIHPSLEMARMIRREQNGDADWALCYKKALKHAHLKSGTKIIFHHIEDWIDALSKKRCTIENDGSKDFGRCIYLDGSPQAIWEACLLYDLSMDHKMMGLMLADFDVSYDDFFREHKHSFSWLSHDQYNFIREIANKYPAVLIRDDGFADVMICAPQMKQSKRIGGFDVSYCSFEIVKWKICLETISFSESETIAEITSSTQDVEDAVANCSKEQCKKIVAQHNAEVFKIFNTGVDF